MVDRLSPDRARLAAIREALPALGAGIYLNTAAAGPIPTESAQAMAAIAVAELRTGRAHASDPLDTLERIGEARAALAAILAAELDSVALTRGTGHGLALGLGAIDWQPGDRAIVLGESIQPTTGWPMGILRSAGVAVVSFAIDEVGGEAAMLQLERVLAAGARAVVVAHVSPERGALLPVETIAARAHATGALVLVDAGLAVGAIPLDPAGLGVDLVAFPSERWLLGPAGLGGAWCGPRMLDRMRTLDPPAFGDAFSKGAGDASWLAAVSAFDRAAVVGLARSCGWLSMHVGMPWAWARGTQLAAWLAGALAEIPGVTVLTPAARQGPVIAFRIEGWGAEAVLDELGPRIFAIAGLTPDHRAIRVSIGCYNSEDELLRFVDGVALVAGCSPATIPPRRTLNVLS